MSYEKQYVPFSDLIEMLKEDKNINVHTLKEKRMIIQSLTKRARNKFNIAIAEVDEQDTHQLIVIGFACVSNEYNHADEMVEKVIQFIEGNTDAIVDNVEKDII